MISAMVAVFRFFAESRRVIGSVVQRSGVYIHILVAARADVGKQPEKADQRNAAGACSYLVKRVVDEVEGFAGYKGNNTACQQHEDNEQPGIYEQPAAAESHVVIKDAAGYPQNHQAVKRSFYNRAF